MPPKPQKPKKPGGKEKKKKDAAPVAEAGAALSIEELKQKVETLEQEKAKEEELRNYMQLERDKISTFWEITQKDLEDKKAELRIKDREIEEREECHQVEIKVYKQKVKHLLYEQQNNIAILKADGETSLKLQAEEGARSTADLQKDKRMLRIELKEQELAHEEVRRALAVEHAKQVSKLRSELEATAKEIGTKSELRLKAAREEADLRRRQEIHQLEERKNAHIQELMRKHEKAFAEIRAYYVDITHNNLDLIKALKEDMAELKKKEAAMEKLTHDIILENKNLSEPLQNAKKEVEALTAQLATHEKDKISLAQSKARLQQLEKLLKNLEWEHEVVQQRLARVQSEYDDLVTRYDTSLNEGKRAAGARAAILERKLAAAKAEVEARDVALAEALQVAGVDDAMAATVKQRASEAVMLKNATIGGLEKDLLKVSKAHNDVLRVYEAKLTAFGIPLEELGFRPLLTHTSPGPAGLVVGA